MFINFFLYFSAFDIQYVEDANSKFIDFLILYFDNFNFYFLFSFSFYIFYNKIFIIKYKIIEYNIFNAFLMNLLILLFSIIANKFNAYY